MTITIEQCHELANKAQQSGESAKFHSEYPRLGAAVYERLQSAYRNLASVLAETEADICLDGIDRDSKRKRRIARLKRRAAYLEVEAAQAACNEHDIGSRIPFGQPILVGHHSERKHRRTIDRMHAQSRKMCELADEAKEAKRLALAAEGNKAIYSDDLQAIEKLAEKIHKLEQQREQMKSLNAQFRKAKGDIDQMPISESDKATLKQERRTWYMGADNWKPYPSYALTNLGAKIREAERRIEEIKAKQAAPEKPERMIGDVRIVENREFDKLELHFPGKPPAEIIQKLKQWGFRWIRSAGCWARSNNNDTEYRLTLLAKELGQ